MSIFRSVCGVVFLAAASVVTGCGVTMNLATTNSTPAIGGTGVAAEIEGTVHGGVQPVIGANVQMYAMGKTGDGSLSTALLTQTVTTNSGGGFSLSANGMPLFSCNGVGQVYLLVTGGNPGSLQANPNLKFMTALGPCSGINSGTKIAVNELSTVAAVSALQPYMSSAVSVGSSSAHALALANANILASELVSTSMGISPGTGVTAATVPTTTINTLADAVSACANSTGGHAGDTTACGKLFTLTTPGGVSAPTDTVTALLYLAAFASLNNTTTTTGIFNLVTSSPPYQATLQSAPANWQIALSTTPGYDVILLVGQSNMVGYGTGTDNAADAAVSSQVFALDYPAGTNIIPAQDPLPMIAPLAGITPGSIGMGLTFAKAYAATLPSNRKVLLVGSAQGGTGFSSGAWVAPSGYLPMDAVQRANSAMVAAGPGARFAGILWHQGESDLGAFPASTYQADLLTLFAYLRSNITGAGATTPFVVGEFNYSFLEDQFYGAGGATNAADVGPQLAVFRSLPDTLNNTAWVNTGGLASDANTGEVHFSAISQRQLGRRYADRFFEASIGLPQPETSQEEWGGFFYDNGRSYVTSQPVNALASSTGTVNIVTDPARGNVAQITAGGGFLSYLVPATTFNGDYTKMVWFNPGASGYFNNLISASNSGQAHFLSVYENGNGTLGIYAGHSNGSAVTIYANPVVNAPSGTWVQLCVVYSASAQTMTTYVNGLPVQTASNVPAAPALNGAAVPLYMGSYTGTAGTVDGEMAGNRVWTSALTPAQVAAMYTYELSYRAGW